MKTTIVRAGYGASRDNSPQRLGHQLQAPEGISHRNAACAVAREGVACRRGAA
jgi:hypothetical protein